MVLIVQRRRNSPIVLHFGIKYAGSQVIPEFNRTREETKKKQKRFLSLFHECLLKFFGSFHVSFHFVSYRDEPVNGLPSNAAIGIGDTCDARIERTGQSRLLDTSTWRVVDILGEKKHLLAEAIELCSFVQLSCT